MGLFDSIRGLFGSRSPRRNAVSECCHYVFAHQALRQLAFDNPLYVAGLATPKGQIILDGLWKEAVACCEGKSGTLDFGPEDILFELERIADRPCVVVTMPTPTHMTHAYFVVIMLPLSMVGETGEGSEVVRYLVLEQGFDLSGQGRTVFCEWTSEGSHLNMGDGPEPSKEAFIRWLEK